MTSPIEKMLTFREQFGDCQRQMFLMDHADLLAQVDPELGTGNELEARIR